MLPSWAQSEGVITKPGGECELLYLHDRGTSWQQLCQCQWWNVLYGFNISFRAVELHTWQFLHHVNALCTNWFFIWWNGMEGLHISKYAVNDASTMIYHQHLQTKISMAKNQKHMYWHVNLGLSMLILWLCSYCASTWRRLAAAREMWISSYIALIVTWRQSSIITWI